MAFVIAFTTVSLLLVSINAAPKNGMAIKIPAECQGLAGFCSVRPEGYDEIEKKFQELLPPFIQDFDKRSSDETFSSNFEDNDNCPFTSTWESDYFYQDPYQTNLDIIVQTKIFPQKWLKVQCKSQSLGGPGVGGKCFTRLGLSVFSQEFECRESKASRSLIIYDPETHTLKPKTFQIPVCCSCHVKSL